MNFKILFIALCATAGAVADPVVLRGVKELHKGVEAGDSNPTQGLGFSPTRSNALARKKSKKQCSGRGRVVTVTNTHTVTASMQQAFVPSTTLAAGSSRTTVIKDTASVDLESSSTASATRSKSIVKSDDTSVSFSSPIMASGRTTAIVKDTTSAEVQSSTTASIRGSSAIIEEKSSSVSSTSSTLVLSRTTTIVQDTTSVEVQSSTTTPIRGSSAIIEEKSSSASSASSALTTGSSSRAVVNGTTSIESDLIRSSTTLVTRSRTTAANKETSVSSPSSTSVTSSSIVNVNNNTTSVELESSATTSISPGTVSSSSVIIADKSTLASSESSSNASATKGGSTTATETTVASSTSLSSSEVAVNTGSTSAKASTTGAPASIPSVNPTDPVPVSRAGDTLNPSAAAEAHEFDDTATRPLESVNIKAPDGRCLSIDPTAGDFRQNLIPVALVECSEAPNQKFDIVTRGKHNDGKALGALLVSVLTNGCISFDGRRQAGDTVTLFSCGGRAAGDGKTDAAQLYPFDGTDNIVLSPASGNDATCLVPGVERLDSGACTKSNDQIFQLVEVL